MNRSKDFYRGEMNVEYYSIWSAIEGIESVVLEFYESESDEYEELENHVKDFMDYLRSLKAKIDGDNKCHVHE